MREPSNSQCRAWAFSETGPNPDFSSYDEKSGLGPVSLKAQALHCEFEGSRIRDVYNVLDFARVPCDRSGFWGFLCDVLNFVISIFLGIPKLIAAFTLRRTPTTAACQAPMTARAEKSNWATRSWYVGDGPMTAPIPATTRSTLCEPCRKPRRRLPTQIPSRLIWNFTKPGAWNWPTCPLTHRPRGTPKAPPATGGDQNMTGAQRATKDAQKRDENRWVYHPAIDGCIPRTRPDPIYSRTDLLISPGESSGSWKER